VFLFLSGLLENPYASEIKNSNVVLLHKKLYLAGKAGVGKTSIIDKLVGRGEDLRGELMSQLYILAIVNTRYEAKS